MKVRTYGWFSGEKGELEIDDLWEWIKQHDGPVMIYPPSITPDHKWVIVTTDLTHRFNQR